MLARARRLRGRHAFLPLVPEEQGDEHRGRDHEQDHHGGDHGVHHAQGLEIGRAQPVRRVTHASEDDRRDGDHRGGDDLLGDEDESLTDVEQTQGGRPEGHGDDPALGPDRHGAHEVDRGHSHPEDRHLAQPWR